MKPYQRCSNRCERELRERRAGLRLLTGARARKRMEAVRRLAVATVRSRIAAAIREELERMSLARSVERFKRAVGL